MTPVKISTLHQLLLIGKLSFTYTTSTNDLRKANGTLNPSEMPNKGGGFDFDGNLRYWDLDKNNWRQVNSNSTIHAQLVKSTPVVSSTTPISLIDAKNLETLLNSKIVKFEYNSSKGTRLAYGTTDKNRLPLSFTDNLTFDNNHLHYYDIEKNGLRTIKLASNPLIKVIEVLDLPLKK